MVGLADDPIIACAVNRQRRPVLQKDHAVHFNSIGVRAGCALENGFGHRMSSLHGARGRESPRAGLAND